MWSIPLVTAPGECCDVQYPLRREELLSLDGMMFGNYNPYGVRHEGPCANDGRLPGMFNTCNVGWGSCTAPALPLLSHALAWWGTC